MGFLEKSEHALRPLSLDVQGLVPVGLFWARAVRDLKLPFCHRH